MIQNNHCNVCSFPKNPLKCLYCDSSPESFILTECMHQFCEKCIQVQKNFLLTKKLFFYRKPERCQNCGEEASDIFEDSNNSSIFLCKRHLNSDYISTKSFKHQSDQNFKESFQDMINQNIKKLESQIEILSEAKSLIFSQINRVVRDTVGKCLEEIRNLKELKHKLFEENYFYSFDYQFVHSLSVQTNFKLLPNIKSQLNGLKRLLSADFISQNYQNYDLFFFDEVQQQLIVTNILTKKIANFSSGKDFLIDSRTQIIKFSTTEFLVIGKVVDRIKNKVYKLNLQDNVIKETKPTPFKVYSPGLVYLDRYVYVFTGGEKCLKYCVDDDSWTSFTGFFIGNERVFAHLFIDSIFVSTENSECIFKYYPTDGKFCKYYQFQSGVKIFATDIVIVKDKILKLRSGHQSYLNNTIFNFENSASLSSAAEFKGEICFYMNSGELVSVNKISLNSKIKLL